MPVSLSDADQKALDRILSVRPAWVDTRRASEAVALPKNTLLHAGPAFDRTVEITRPILNSACVAAVFEDLAGDFAAAEAAIMAGDIVLRPAQDFGVVTPLAGVVSSSVWLHQVADKSMPSHHCFSPLNGGNGPATRLGLLSDAALAHFRWVNGPFCDALRYAFDRQAPTGGIDLIPIVAEALRQGDDGHGRTAAATALLLETLSPAIDEQAASRAFLEDGPSFFLNIWMAACKCILSAAEGISNSSLVTASGGNGARTGVQLAGQPGRWFTHDAAPPNGNLGEADPDRALGAIGDSAIVDMAGFGAMSMSFAPVQRDALLPFAPAGALDLPAQLLSGFHPAFDELDFRMGLCAAAVVSQEVVPIISLGILDKRGEAGRLGGGIFQVPLALFQDALAGLSEA
ncbi:MAG: DUF1116 domain-containing protein [Pseudomonadota bacterium]